MTWHTLYLSDTAGGIARMIDALPYHAPLLLLPSGSSALCTARLANLREAIRAEQMRPANCSSQPYHLVIDVSDLCNLRCPLCVQATEPGGRRRTTLSLSTAAAALDAFPNALLRVEFFNWGEPFLNPAFLDIVRHAEAANVFSRTSSHFSVRALDMNAVVDSGLKCLVLSVDGVTQKTYEKYRVGGNLDLVLHNARKLVDAKRVRGKIFPIIEWQFLALKHNLDEIESALVLAQEIGVDVFRYGGARGEMAARIRVTDEENYASSRHVLLEGSHPLSEYQADGKKLHAREKEGCRWLWGKLAVHADGGISPCWTSWQREFDFGSLRDHSLDRHWRSETFAAARAAATGRVGVTGPARLCEQCASCEGFVNAPERLPNWPIRRQVQEAADCFAQAGLPIDPGIQHTIEVFCE